MTGMSALYETPENPDLEIDTVKEAVEESVDKIFNYLKEDYMSNYIISHLRELDQLTLREIAAQFEKSVLLFSGGKVAFADSFSKKSLLSIKYLSLVHIDTEHNFPE